jgi:hypothetical protein
MYLVGLGHVGCKDRASKPTIPESALTDPVDYMEIPLSLLDKYWWRAVLAAEQYPSLEWLKAQDQQERLMWVKSFSDPANANKSLGSIINSVFLQRSAHWDVSVLQVPKPPKQGRVNLKTADGANRGYIPAQGSMADELRDGTLLCRAWNEKAGCSDKGCQKAHRCSYMQSSGRVCGSWAHTFQKCPQHRR